MCDDNIHGVHEENDVDVHILTFMIHQFLHHFNVFTCEVSKRHNNHRSSSVQTHIQHIIIIFFRSNVKRFVQMKEQYSITTILQ